MSLAAKIIIPVVILIVGAGLMLLFMNMGGDSTRRGGKPQVKIIETEKVFHGFHIYFVVAQKK